MRRRFPRSTRRSLGLLMHADGLALAQASAPAQGPLHIQHWHWLATGRPQDSLISLQKTSIHKPDPQGRGSCMYT